MGWTGKLRRWLRGKKRGLAERLPQYEIGRASCGDLEVLSWKEGATLKVGSFCSFAAGVKIFLGGEHRTDWVTTFPFPELWKEAAGHIQGHPKTRGDVIIGNDVWIGAEAVILSGVRIGDGAVVGARAVVTRDVPPYAIVAGNPAVLIRLRFAEPVIESLRDIAWWNWTDERITQLMPLLLSEHIEDFISAATVEEAGAPLAEILVLSKGFRAARRHWPGAGENAGTVAGGAGAVGCGPVLFVVDGAGDPVHPRHYVWRAVRQRPSKNCRHPLPKARST